MIEIDAAATPWSAASFCMGTDARTVLFEHQAPSPGERAYSIVLTAPDDWLIEEGGAFYSGPSRAVVDDPLQWIKARHGSANHTAELPFVGGLAGYLSFEFGWYLDAFDEEPQVGPAPKLWVGDFPAAAVYDHQRKNWTVAGRHRNAVEELAEKVRAAPAAADIGTGRGSRRREREIDANTYEQRVQRAVDAIYAGELFEVNYTERFFGQWSGDRRVLYQALRDRAPGDYGGIVDIPEIFIASISPEQFLMVDADGTVITRPIKGTRPRGESPDEDARLARELEQSAKDRAENIMIVDLMRNDLTQICKPGTVRATKLCELLSFESVHHLVSTVEGELDDDFDGFDAFIASFPAGSITGAPKLRSMEWIAENEETPRGPYTGSLFYWSDHGRLDSNVLIRTAVLNGEAVEYGSGGAVVADSNPAGEYEEACWKAAPFFEFLL